MANLLLKRSRLELYYALHNPFSHSRRAKRMQTFLSALDVKEGVSILDLGGNHEMWASVPSPLKITLLNLPDGEGPPPPSNTHHAFTHIEGDACDLKLPPGASFDIVFSNSVLEHVGDEAKQEAFAREVRRLGLPYWVQTPAKWFPIECHSGMLFWWFYPEWLRSLLINRWRKVLPEWAQYIEDTRVLSKRRLQELFPEAEIYVERFFGITKSYSVWHKPKRLGS